MLSHLGYSEWAGYGYVEFEGYGNLPKWAYEPPQRHDFDYADEIAKAQTGVLKEMFSAPVLARMAAGPSETADPNPMRLGDLFTWMHASVLRELRAAPATIDPMRRTLQQRYMDTLVALYSAPETEAPDDARALARAELAAIEREALHAADKAVDATTRAHLLLLATRAHQALTPGH